MKKASAQLLLDRLLDNMTAADLLLLEPEMFSAIKELQEAANAVSELVDVFIENNQATPASVILAVMMQTEWTHHQAVGLIAKQRGEDWIGPVRTAPRSLIPSIKHSIKTYTALDIKAVDHEAIQ